MIPIIILSSLGFTLFCFAIVAYSSDGDIQGANFIGAMLTGAILVIACFDIDDLFGAFVLAFAILFFVISVVRAVRK